MGIWIRSQNKQVLANIVSILINEDNLVLGYDECSNDKDSFYYLGNYSSKEKAIKVLEMIQNHIEKVGTFSMSESKVFQMPQDSEVAE